MCLEDKRLGRKTATSARAVTAIGGSTNMIIPPSPDRVFIGFYFNNQNFLVNPSGYDMDTMTGAVVSATNGKFELDIERHGNIVTQGFVLVGDPIDARVLVIESFLADK